MIYLISALVIADKQIQTLSVMQRHPKRLLLVAAAMLLSACATPREEDPMDRAIRHCRELGYPRASEELRECVQEQQLLHSIDGGIKRLLSPRY